MKKELKEAWIDALRSGDYRQAEGSLKFERTPGDIGYCCLGVLCKVLEKKEMLPDGITLEERSDRLKVSVAFEGEVREISDTQLPRGLRKHVGLPKELMRSLIAINDNEGTFDEIADRIYSDVPEEA